MSRGSVIDLFAGCGGWDLGARALGLDPVGLELDDAACATRRAAGLRTMQCDVAEVDFECGWLGLRRYGLIASPPCPTFSAAGQGAGRLLTSVIARAMHELAAGSDTRPERREEAYVVLEPVAWEAEQARARKKNREPERERARARARRDADMSLLVVEPLRWALALDPEWVALEQVPACLGLWSEMAQILGVLGYSTWAGVLELERYGVPQTRDRAVLLATKNGVAEPPLPTHQRYIPPGPDDSEPAPGLFDLPARQRVVLPEDRHLLPWVSMAEALGWGMTRRPAMTFAPGTKSGGASLDGGGSGARAVLQAERDAGRWVFERPATTVAGDPRISEPGWRGGRRQYEEDGAYTGKRSMDDAIRLTLAEALVLQAFPPGYPVQGNKGQQYTQAGNAVPPLAAFHILQAVTGLQAAGEVADAA